MRSVAINVLLCTIGLIGAVIGVLSVSAGMSYVGPRTEAVTATTTTPGTFAPYTALDAAQIDDQRTGTVGWAPYLDGRIAVQECDTDTDCVTRNPRLIPDEYTVDAYWRVWGEPHFPTIGDCSSVDWTETDSAGNYYVPIDLDHDGAINCGSDFELGA